MDSIQIGFVPQVNCCSNCKHGEYFISISGHEEIECCKWNMDVSPTSICQYYEDE